MKRICAEIEYLGTNFCGFQIQPEKRTVQGEIERVLKDILCEDIKIYASGRTDAGVHALGQVIHFDTKDDSINLKKILFNLNKDLPEDIRFVDIKEVSCDFDSRFSVKRKTYIYKFYLSRFDRPIYKNLALRVNDNVDVKKMSEACQYLLGKHDFRSFVARKSGKTDFVRTIFDANIEQCDNGLFEFKITGDGFLYNMVRIIFGTLVEIGSKKDKSPMDIKKIIESKNRAMAGKTVQPYGLYLKKVEYL